MNLIVIFLAREYNADGFQKNIKRIYALQADDPFNKGGKIYYIRFGAAEYMKNNFPEVEDFCRISNVNPVKMTVGQQDFFDEKKVIAVSSNFFRFFSYQLLSNKPENVLRTSHDLVISQNLATKYFGNSDPVGQRITIVNHDDQNEMIVMGVFKKPDESTQLSFDMVRLIGESDSRCYLLLAENTNIKKFEENLTRNKASIPNVDIGGSYYFKPMKDAYFDTSRNLTIENSRDKNDLVIALAIASMILAIAIFNYLGLINNRVMEKTKEHTIRLVNGGSQMNLLTSFISETAILIVMSYLISILLTIQVMPFFNHLTSSSIRFSYIFRFKNIILSLGIPVLVLLITFLFAFIRIGKNIETEALKSVKFRFEVKFHIPVFHITQLTISVILIIASMIILKQINYITNKEIGLDKDVIEVKIPEQYKDITVVFKSELEKDPDIKFVSVADASPVFEHWMCLLEYDDNGIKKEYTPSIFGGDQSYIKALGIKIVEGNDFSGNPESDKNKCIINESLAKLFPGQDLVGKELPGDKDMTVIGIVKDFNYGSLKELVGPGYVVCKNSGFSLMVKPFTGKTAQAGEIISKVWNKLIMDFPLNVESIRDRYEWMHRENKNYAKLIGACCLISVFLSMIGLFAVSYHSSRRRIKEIGIRKVNGAKIEEVMLMLNKNIVRWSMIAFLVAVPVAWYTMHKWLENFAYKTKLSWWVFASAGLISIVISLLTVSWQSWKAATRNPVYSLRYE